MKINRRRVVSAASALAAGAALSPRARAAEPVDASGALRAYAEAHRRKFGLPGFTLVAGDVKRGTAFQNLGFADVAERRAVCSQDLFQIGSISKSRRRLFRAYPRRRPPASPDEASG